MNLYVAGGCSEHGRNSYYVATETVCFLVDAGVMKEHPERRWPALTEEQIRKADYLFLTHCHTDHTGAIPWLYDHGFKGKVVASRATLRLTSRTVRDSLVLEELGSACSEFRLGDLSVIWGRSGHCIGSVWYRFEAGGKSIFFSGDYQERTYAYECDEVRGMKADLAVIDCAYGVEQEDADQHRAELEEALDRLTATDQPLLFPVPSHGRGTDLLELLSKRGRTVVVGKMILQEFMSHENRDFWLRPAFREAFDGLSFIHYENFAKAIGNCPAPDAFPEEFRNTGILVRDSQLYDEAHGRAADRVIDAGGTVILTGKQDPASYARTLLDQGRAVFYRISVHQNCDEFRRLADRNSFTRSVPCHCRQQLQFSDPDVLILKPEDTYYV